MTATAWPEVPLGALVAPAKVKRAGDQEHRVLSITRARGLVPQDSVFKKRIAGDVSKYRVVSPNQLVVGIHVDEGALGMSGPSQTGIVSPAYRIWDLARPDLVLPAYLDRFVRSPAAVGYYVAGYRNTAERRGKLTNEQFLALGVPLPSLEEQRRIATILDAVDELRTKRRTSLALIDSLTESIFLDMFRDPVTNPNDWPVVQIGDVLESATYGTSKKAGAEGEFPVLRMGNVTMEGDIDLADLKYVDLTSAEQTKHLVRAGDILFNRTNSPELVGKSAVYRLEAPMAYAGYLVRLRCRETCSPEFLGAFLNLRSTKRIFRSRCKAIVGMANINAREVQAFTVPRPPLALQQEFEERVARARQVRVVKHAARDELDTLFASLQHRAFRGEL